MVAARPESSAAATRSSVCAAAGSRRYRSRKARSTPSVRGSRSGSRSCPDSCSAVRARVSSSSAERVAFGDLQQLGSYLRGDRDAGLVGDAARSAGGLVDAGDGQRRQVAGVEGSRSRRRGRRTGARRPRPRAGARRTAAPPRRRRRASGRRRRQRAPAGSRRPRRAGSAWPGRRGGGRRRSRSSRRTRPAGRCLRGRDVVQVAEHRSQEPVQCRERQRRLGLDSPGAQRRPCRRRPPRRPRGAPTCRRPAGRAAAAPIRARFGRGRGAPAAPPAPVPSPATRSSP